LRRWLGWGLCGLSAFMALGFIQVGVTSWASLIALLIGAGIPGMAGLAVLRASPTRKALARIEALREQTLHSEIIRLASQRGGKLTAVEVVAELAIPVDEAHATLDELARTQVAELEVTDSGALVYDFPDVRLLGEKSTARGILDA